MRRTPINETSTRMLSLWERDRVRACGRSNIGRAASTKRSSGPELVAGIFSTPTCKPRRRFGGVATGLVPEETPAYPNVLER